MTVHPLRTLGACPALDSKLQGRCKCVRVSVSPGSAMGAAMGLLALGRGVVRGRLTLPVSVGGVGVPALGSRAGSMGC